MQKGHLLNDVRKWPTDFKCIKKRGPTSLRWRQPDQVQRVRIVKYVSVFLKDTPSGERIYYFLHNYNIL